MALPPSPAAHPPPSTIEYYRIYRKYVQHQYDLINHRTNWNIGIQSILIGAFAFTLQKKTDLMSWSGDGPERYAAIHELQAFLVGLGILGLVLTFIFWRLLQAASEPVDDANKEWDLGLDLRRMTPQTYHLPNMTGFRGEKNRTRGRHLLTKYLSPAFAFFWIAASAANLWHWH